MITASSSDPIAGVELGLTPTGHTWVFGLEFSCSAVVSSSSLLSPMAKLFAPLLGSWARYSRHEGGLCQGCTAQDVHVLHKMFACPSCLTHPTRSVHSWLSMCPSAPHFCPATVTIPHRQGRCAPPTSSNPWPQQGLSPLCIGW